MCRQLCNEPLTDEDFRAFVKAAVIRERRIMSPVRVDAGLFDNDVFLPYAHVNSISGNSISCSF